MAFLCDILDVTGKLNKQLQTGDLNFSSVPAFQKRAHDELDSILQHITGVETKSACSPTPYFDQREEFLRKLARGVKELEFHTTRLPGQMSFTSLLVKLLCQ